MGVIIARFQVPHLTEVHHDLIRTVTAKHNKVIVFLGLSALVGSINNPLDFEARKLMLQEAYPGINIFYIKDTPDDHVWSQNLDKLIADHLLPGKTPILYGGRDSFIKRYFGKFPTVEFDEVAFISGTELRKEAGSKVKATGEWRSGVIWGVSNKYPAVVLTVDVVVYDEKNRILLGRKPEETLFRFCGGHAEPKSAHFVDDARREVMEEMGDMELSPLVLIGDALIDDWRYRGEADKIHTLFYKAKFLWGSPRPADGELAEVRWFDLDKLTELEIVPEHRILYKMMKETKL